MLCTATREPAAAAHAAAHALPARLRHTAPPCRVSASRADLEVSCRHLLAGRIGGVHKHGGQVAVALQMEPTTIDRRVWHERQAGMQGYANRSSVAEPRAAGAFAARTPARREQGEARRLACSRLVSALRATASLGGPQSASLAGTGCADSMRSIQANTRPCMVGWSVLVPPPSRAHRPACLRAQLCMRVQQNADTALRRVSAPTRQPTAPGLTARVAMLQCMNACLWVAHVLAKHPTNQHGRHAKVCCMLQNLCNNCQAAGQRTKGAAPGVYAQRFIPTLSCQKCLKRMTAIVKTSPELSTMSLSTSLPASASLMRALAAAAGTQARDSRECNRQWAGDALAVQGCAPARTLACGALQRMLTRKLTLGDDAAQVGTELSGLLRLLAVQRKHVVQRTPRLRRGRRRGADARVCVWQSS